MGARKIERCWGVTLWRGRRRRLELWVCLEGVGAHRHPNQWVEVMPLWGWSEFARQTPEGKVEGVSVRPGTWLRWFSIPGGWRHWFTVRRGPLVFLNLTFDGQSAAENFVTDGKNAGNGKND